MSHEKSFIRQKIILYDMANSKKSERHHEHCSCKEIELLSRQNIFIYSNLPILKNSPEQKLMNLDTYQLRNL